ncbi:hypothetical protein ARMSODRAFT_335768 [Armillaria solidipes]|uniref:Uncharacterized protein n=1 Tax=Armillaria solidipes TaxID=1076256 RepID=A0A2H3B822_9AGAR|nr:hypothetical protein ARMSODRAFT_335768 [Armillaria solidipes]
MLAKLGSLEPGSSTDAVSFRVYLAVFLSISFSELPCSPLTCLVFRAEHDLSLKVGFSTQPTCRDVASFPGFKCSTFQLLPASPPSRRNYIPSCVVGSSVSPKINARLVVVNILFYIPSKFGAFHDVEKLSTKSCSALQDCPIVEQENDTLYASMADV